ncbi:hypothetical protein [Streptomyces sp. NPDC017940]|uniref:hypothetical protein n=1 Tax=Streptomyces sp. NPDC017940 TaxID=3365017 RepID=UPI00378AF7AD
MTTIPKTGAPEPQPSQYVWGDALHALTDRLSNSSSFAEATGPLQQILTPTHGLLERLAEFFEAAGEKAKEAEQEDGDSLVDEFEEAAAVIRCLGADLHTAPDRMRVLTAPLQPHRSRQTPPCTPLTPRPAPPSPPYPHHTR